MRNLISLIILTSFLSCGQSQNQQSSLKHESNNDNVIDFPENEGFIDQNITFKHVHKTVVGQKEIMLSNCVGWENDPGDFRKIEIGNSELKNFGGWIKVPENFLKFSNNEYFLSLENNNLMVLFGYEYASDPGFLTLITIGNTEPQIIFNRKAYLREVLESEDGYSLHVEFDGSDHIIKVHDGKLIVQEGNK